MHVLKPLVGDGEVSNRWDRVSNYLGLLTRDTFTSPSRHVLVHRRPHDLGADGLTRPLDAWMTEAMNGIENWFAEGKRNKWPCWAIADVDNQTRLSYVDAFELQARPCVISDAAEVGIQCLLRGNFIPVDAERGNGVYHATEVFLCGVSSCCCVS